jgi:hypothetical protein
MVILLLLTLVTAEDNQVIFDWGAVPSYSNYDLAPTLKPGTYKIGFTTNNFYLFASLKDTISYDLRTLDLFARMGLTEKLDFGLKYSSPRAGLVSVKYQFLSRPIASSFSIGFGYMKATRVVRPVNLTYYLFDIYPSILFTKRVSRNFGFYGSLKSIISRYAEEDNSDNWTVFHYGGGIGLLFGPERFHFMVETDYYKALTNKKTTFIAGQSGIGVEAQL